MRAPRITLAWVQSATPEELLSRLRGYIFWCKNLYFSGVPDNADLDQALIVAFLEVLRNRGSMATISTFMREVRKAVVREAAQHVRDTDRARRIGLYGDLLKDEDLVPVERWSFNRFKPESPDYHCLNCGKDPAGLALSRRHAEHRMLNRGLCATCDRRRVKMKKRFGSMGACRRCGHVLNSDNGQPRCATCGVPDLGTGDQHA